MFKKHVSDKDQMLLLGDELSLTHRQQVEKHLSVCSDCHERYKRLSLTALRVSEYCEYRGTSDISLSNSRREIFLNRLDQLERERSHSTPKQQRRESAFPISFPNMNPTLGISIALAVASAVFFFISIQQKKPNVTSNAFLVRAEAWDASSSSSKPGVIYQKVGIRTPQHRVYRMIYHDAQGIRKPRLRKLANDEEQLKETLATAGIAWEAPLSATVFQDWHDRQRVRQDQIKRSKGSLLVLTTTTPDGLIAEQSLTVRDSDFHPVERKVVLRDSGIIEIAELEYQVLPWNSVDAGLFENGRMSSAEHDVSVQPTQIVRLPSKLTDAQLNEAELSARLILNTFHGDTGEQILLERNAQGVEIKGLVETEARKRELRQQLQLLSHTTVSILSVEELRRNAAVNGPITNVGISSAAAQPSPLETLFLAQARSVDLLSGLFQGLVDDAVTINQESRAMTDLLTRFSSSEKMTDLARATLSELVYSHRERLLLALEHEQTLLDKIGMEDSVKPLEEVTGSGTSLISAAERNLALCKELTFGGASPTRKAQSIVADLFASINEVRVSARETTLNSRKAVTIGGNK